MMPELSEIYDGENKRKDIALILVTFNQKEMTKAYIKKIKKQSLIPDIIVVDNDSIDGTFEGLKNSFKDITLLKAKHNYGGAGGYYLGQKYAFKKRCKYVILSENDVFSFGKDLNKLTKLE